MSFDGCKVVWMNGKLISDEEATIHILSHVIHYGTSVFEGIRAYKTPRGTAVFRLKAHIQRLFNSAKMYRMNLCYPDGKTQFDPEDRTVLARGCDAAGKEPSWLRFPWTEEEVMKACMDTVKANNLDACYLRPVMYRGYASLGVDPFTTPTSLAIAVWRWGKYLGPEALEKGVSVCVSSWNRMAPNTFPALAKCGANYMNSQLIKMEAIVNGYTEGIALDVNGYVSEGSGENLFMIKDGIIYTPPLGASVLPGITRDTVITIAKDLGFTVREHLIPREMLYIADEVFFTGTAAEVSPIAYIDHIKIGNGARGPVAKQLQDAFFDIIECRAPDRYGWLEYIEKA
jgi:branched-chain amino acid aminotransferase